MEMLSFEGIIPFTRLSRASGSEIPRFAWPSVRRRTERTVGEEEVGGEERREDTDIPRPPEMLVQPVVRIRPTAGWQL
jgi:hypothetical protein